MRRSLLRITTSILVAILSLTTIITLARLSGAALPAIAQADQASNQPAMPQELDSLRQNPAPNPSQNGWVIECVDCPKYMSYANDRSIAIDSNGHPHIVYGGDHLYHAWYDGTVWQTEVADNSPAVGGDAAMVLDGSGYIHAVYNDWFDTTLKYAYQDITGWHTQTITGTVNPWRYKSIGLDAEGYPHISFYAGYPAYRLDYAYLDASGWHIQTVDIG